MIPRFTTTTMAITSKMARIGMPMDKHKGTARDMSAKAVAAASRTVTTMGKATTSGTMTMTTTAICGRTTLVLRKSARTLTGLRWATMLK